MAYAFGFPASVTDLIYSMRDWRWERVRDGVPTPSAMCFEPMDEFGIPWDVPTFSTSWIELRRAPEYWAEFVYGRWRCHQAHVNRNRARIYVYDGCWESDDPPCIELPNQNLEKLQEKLEAATAELWWQCEPCESYDCAQRA